MQKKSWILAGFLILSLIGLADSIYLTYEHYVSTSLVCILGSGCDIVTTSKYSEIFGVYIAVYGIIYYFIIFLLSILGLLPKTRRFTPASPARFDQASVRRADKLDALRYITPIGFVASFYFVYLQIFVIGAICAWCVISAIDSALLFILGLYAKNNHLKHAPTPP
ncbi:vitamin K epoxide reductase family protein [Candidatus Microgenomates bacterium]|nr:vitamin K epoxide reductase family protein [Candidatus Microgenomates bacterium]